MVHPTETDLESIPDVRKLVGDDQSLAVFRGPASSVLEWSQSQDPECRHYVQIADAATTKDGYKNKRLVVENYFYKYELRQRPDATGGPR